jgi:hypothetical protein
MESSLRRCKWTGPNSSNLTKAIRNVWGLQPVAELRHLLLWRAYIWTILNKYSCLYPVLMNNDFKWWTLKEKTKRKILRLELTRLKLHFTLVFQKCVCMYVYTHTHKQTLPPFIPSLLLKFIITNFQSHSFVLLCLCFPMPRLRKQTFMFSSRHPQKQIPTKTWPKVNWRRNRKDWNSLWLPSWFLSGP